MHSPLPLTRDLVLVGGGHTHALVLRAFARRPLAGVRLTLVDPGPVAAYSGMLPGFVAGHYSRAALEIDLVRLARAAGARLVTGAAEGIDPAAGRVHIAGRAPIGWDLVSVDVGITSAMPDLAGFNAHAVPAKPLSPFAERWAAFAGRVAAGEITAPRVAVIGAGVAGVELALAMAHRLRGANAAIILIDAGAMGAGLGAAARRELRRALDAHGVRLIQNAPVAGLDGDGVHLATGRVVAADFVTGAAGARPHGWITGSGLAVTDGFIDVDDRLRSISHPEVYAAGDCAHMTFAPRPKAGVYAVRQAPVLTHNLRAALAGGMPRRYRPQRDYLKLISLGGREALVERSGLTLRAPWLWRWKNRIDRDFMDRFRRLRPMAPAPVTGDAARGARAMAGAPLCGGCGAKVGPDALAAALAHLPAPARPDILSRPGDDAAVIDTGGARQVITTDHLRAVVDDPGLMARIAALHALGDVWAMGAAPQAALATIILPRMAETLQARTLAEITQAAGAVLAEAGAALAGGHTTMGAELTIGFTVTGLAARAVSLAGAQPGDALVLTRPIGSGTILAAGMRGRASGRDLAALHALLATPQGDAAARLAPVAHAMTDVTGFGLAGHLLTILRASRCAARLDLAEVPMLDAALPLAARGIASTLAPGNRAHAAGAIDGLENNASARLLFDPQTCGGLLAAVPQGNAAGLVYDLRALGHGAAVIGAITHGAPRIVLD